MKKRLLETIALALCSVFLPAQVLGQSNTQSSNAGVRLEAGIAKEEADGDLKAAMTVYQQIAGDSSAPRAVRAKALLRLGRCDEKLGQQARQVYEQILRDYADQPVVVQARTRLAALKQQESPAAPNTMTTRKIDWHSVGEMGSSDTDGQRAVYRAADGNLYYGDLSGHTKKLVFKPTGKEMLGWIPSRDFSLVALILRAQDNPEMAIIAIVRTDGTGYRELIHDDARGGEFGSLSLRLSWSWGNRFLLVSKAPQSGMGHLVLVSVADGKRRELLRAQEGADVYSRAVMSPDNRFAAYECLSRKSGHSGIFVMPVDGGAPHLVYEPARPSLVHPTLLDWTSDSQNLVVSDVRGLTSGVFQLPVKNGLADGGPQIIRQGSIEDGWTTSAGTLVYQDRPTRAGRSSKFLLASFDGGGHIGQWDRINVENEDASGRPWPWPSFSPDSRNIAYTIRDDHAGYLVVRSVADGAERVVYSSKELLFCHYGSQGSDVFCTEPVKSGHTNILSISSANGEVTPMGSIDGLAVILRAGQDNSSLYLGQNLFDAAGGYRGNLVAWDATSHHEDVVIPKFAEKDPAYDPVSLKCNWLVKLNKGNLLSRPMTGGDWSTIASIKGAPEVDQFVTTADEQWVIFHDLDESGKDCLFRVPIAGGKPELVGEFPSHDFQSGSLQVSPDGRRILADLPDDQPYDLWVLSNFLPKR
jgi:Tol biopolymer transport system component